MFYDNYEKLCEKNGEKPFALPIKLGAKSNSMVAQWKKGSTPRPEMLQKIADYLGVTTTELLYGESEQKEKDPVISDEASEQRKRLMEQLSSLSPDQLDQALSYIEFLASNSKK